MNIQIDKTEFIFPLKQTLTVQKRSSKGNSIRISVISCQITPGQLRYAAMILFVEFSSTAFISYIHKRLTSIQMQIMRQ